MKVRKYERGYIIMRLLANELRILRVMSDKGYRYIARSGDAFGREMLTFFENEPKMQTLDNGNVWWKNDTGQHNRIQNPAFDSAIFQFVKINHLPIEINALLDASLVKDTFVQKVGA